MQTTMSVEQPVRRVLRLVQRTPSRTVVILVAVIVMYQKPRRVHKMHVRSQLTVRRIRVILAPQGPVRTRIITVRLTQRVHRQIVRKR